jgi:hypothetical protein
MGRPDDERSPSGSLLPPMPPDRPPSRAVASVVALAMLLLGGGVTAAVVAAQTQGRHRAPVVLPSGPAIPAYTPSPPPSAPARVAGWHAVVAVKHGLTYDVPPATWSVKSAGTIVGFEDPQGRPEVAGSGVSVYKEGYCPARGGSWRAEAAVSGYGATNPADDATEAAREWATYGYTSGTTGTAPTVTLSAARHLPEHRAVEVTATVTVHDDDTCAPPRSVVHAVALPVDKDEVAVLVVLADQDVPDAMTDTDLERIATSARPTA